MSEECIKTPSTSDNSFAPKIIDSNDYEMLYLRETV